jgi:hypothetical protein
MRKRQFSAILVSMAPVANGSDRDSSPDRGRSCAAVDSQTDRREVGPGASTDTSFGEYDNGHRRSFIAVAYWAAWVAFGMWGFRFLFAYRRNALWMALAVFLFTQGDVLPAYRLRRPLRSIALVLASIACAMLLYCTSDWWFAVFEGWHSSSNDPWVRQTLQRLWFPTM